MLVTTLPAPSHALAPKSIFEKKDEDVQQFVKRLMAKAIGEAEAKNIPRSEGMDVFKKLTGEGNCRYLITGDISKSDLPSGYPIALREPNPSKSLPGEIKVTMPDTDVFLVNQLHNGAFSVVRLGWLEDGTPVAVKSRYTEDAADDNQRVQDDYNDAFFADRLGIGPRLHGCFTDGQGRFSFAMDIVPGEFAGVGDFILQSSNYITITTIRDLEEINRRLIAAGKSMSFDFQYFITPEGRVLIIDPEGICDADPDRIHLYIGHLVHLLVLAPDFVQREYLRDAARERPALLRLIDATIGFQINMTEATNPNATARLQEYHALRANVLAAQSTAPQIMMPQEIWASRQWTIVTEAELNSRHLAGKKVLRVGPSTFKEHEAAEALLGADVTAIDIEPSVIEKFDFLKREIYDEFPGIAAAGGNITYRPWDVMNLDEQIQRGELAPHSFDHVSMMRVETLSQDTLVSLGIAQMYPFWEKTADNLLSLLKPDGGTLLVTATEHQEFCRIFGERNIAHTSVKLPEMCLSD